MFAQFLCNFDSHTFKGFCVLAYKNNPPSQVTDWNNRQVAVGGGVLIQFKDRLADTVEISVEEYRVS